MSLSNKIREFIFLTAVVFGFTASANAISEPPTRSDWRAAGDHLFLEGEVAIIEITMDVPGQFQQMINNPESNEMFVCSVRFKNSVIDEVIEDVGIRPRGNTSRQAARKAFKLDINDFVRGRDFYGLEAINIYGDPNDPTWLRRRLAHELKMRMGLPTSRTHYAAVYIDDTGTGEFVFRSIAVHVEHIDDEFCAAWFRNKNGNLYKARFRGEQADLTYRADENYAGVGGGQTYEEKRNYPDTDWSDLAALIDLINNAPSSQIYSELETLLNVDNFLRYMAANVALGSWDDYWYGSNNYYLYWNQRTERFEWIPFDYDNVLGLDFFNTDWSTRHFDGWGNGGFGSNAPLVHAVFTHSAWRHQFRRYLLEAVEILEDPEYRGLIDEYHNLIKPWFDGTIESGGTVGTITQGNEHHPYFENYNSPSTYRGGNFHTIGVLPFIERRATSLRQQIDTFIGVTTPNPRVYINEVMAANSNTLPDNTLEFEDWIELYNAEDEDIDISGWHITDRLDDPLMYVIPDGTVIPANGYLVIWASGEPERTQPGFVHTNFRLSRDGEAVGLFHNEQEGRVLIDWMIFPALMTDQSYGPYPDGTGDHQPFFFPTPGAPNDGSITGGTDPRTPPRLFINEFMASNGETIADRFGDYSDWIEIYNDEDEPVDMSGMYLTDDLTRPGMWRFPDGVTIPAKGFILVWADNNPERTTGEHLHADFALSISGEEIGLYDNDENERQPIDTFVFSQQIRDVSMGRIPDGTGDFQFLDIATPGFSNEAVDEPTFSDLWMIK